jgi:hypothetical protein
MSLVAPDGDPANSQQISQGGNSSADSVPTSPSTALFKGLGDLLAKRKHQDEAAASDTNGNLPPRPSTPGSPMEMTVEVTSFSSGALDDRLFEIPAGYTQAQADPTQLMYGNRGR